MNIPTQLTPSQLMALTAREQALVETLRLLGEILPDAFERVETQVWNLVGEHLKWDWSDPQSVQRASQFMCLDPEIQRESQAIAADFANLERASLENR